MIHRHTASSWYIIMIHRHGASSWYTVMVLTLRYGLQSSSARRWWMRASVISFLVGLYSSSCMSMFQVEVSNWLKLGLEHFNRIQLIYLLYVVLMSKFLNLVSETSGTVTSEADGSGKDRVEKSLAILEKSINIITVYFWECSVWWAVSIKSNWQIVEPAVRQTARVYYTTTKLTTVFIFWLDYLLLTTFWKIAFSIG